MPDHERKFVGYNGGEHGLLLGYGERVIPGQRIKEKTKFYEVEEVHAHGTGLWTASVKRTGNVRSL